MPHQRLQFPVRAIFVLTLFAGLLAGVARWLLNVDGAGQYVLSVSLGFMLGFAIPVILDHVHVTAFLITMLVILCLFGLWFATRRFGYLVGGIVGAISALYGVTIVNAILGFSGVVVVVDANETQPEQRDP